MHLQGLKYIFGGEWSNSVTQAIDYIVSIKNMVDTSSVGGRRMFYTICYTVARKYLHQFNNNVLALNTIQTLLDSIIQAEQMLFSRSLLLDFCVRFLINNSDGQNLQCLINTQLLDYLLNKYDFKY
ncbi:ac19-like protein [Clanis bilineata nucleopolyhedrovirus]|uniref:Ac19-like protein n=1 Tax=Clanis bilineata nucleopolyhedrovirus TaxID=1307957 RepID=Q0N3Y7_9ABAC|nr:ac19-like protein [Clanis bilineata nucleopolyhedrovirus]ABF47456.1 ac19-like protein [Clanis bilineata nucleopolyhedrovirus]